MNTPFDRDPEQLAVLAVRGDRDALEELVRQLHQPLWRFSYHLTGDRDLADEAAQETWLRVVQALPRFRGESSVLTWLLAIARRVVADLIRRRCRPTPQTEPSPAWASTGLVELQTQIACLSPVLGEALVLTQIVGLSYEEAGQVMGVPIGTVRSRVFRARAALLASLAGEAEIAVAQPGTGS